MKTIFRTSALALALLAGSALVAAPAMADRDRGDYHHWKKSWKKHGHYRRHYRHYRHHRHAYRHRHHRRYYYGWGWPYVYGGPGFSLYIR
jgi:hypothetical protein